MTRTAVVQAQQRWEYSTLTRMTEGAIISELKLAGQEGWELVTMLYYKDLKGTMCWTAVMKRPNTGPSAISAAKQQSAPTVVQVPKAPQAASPGAESDASDEGEFEFQKE
ncbi:MAG: hypothetical protein ABSF26_05300 [Thermoguttaceae bacterium]